MKKTLAILLVLCLALALLAGCGKTGDTGTAGGTTGGTTGGASGGTTGGGTSGGFQWAELPAVPDLGGVESGAWLEAQEDQNSLAGAVSGQLASRADVYKALDKLDLNDKDVEIAWMSATLGSPYFVNLTNSAQRRADELGYKITFYDANFTLTTQQDQFETVLNTNADIIVCNAVDIHAEKELFTRACDAGKPVIVIGPTSGKPEYQLITTVLTGAWVSGYEVGYYTCGKLAEQFPGGVKVGGLICQYGDSASESRVNGFMAGYLMCYSEMAGKPYASKWDAAVIAYQGFLQLRDKGSFEIPGILNFVQCVTTNSIDTASAPPKCAELLTAHPDLDIAFVETDSFSLAMVTECQQQDLVPGKDIYIVYAADGSGELCKAVKDGLVLTCGSNPPAFCGECVVDLIHDIYNGKDCNDLPINSYTPAYALSTENIDQVWKEGDDYAAILNEWHVQTTEEYNEANK